MLENDLSVIFNEELQGITNGEALIGDEKALTGNVEELNDNEQAVKFDWVCLKVVERHSRATRKR